MTSAESTNYAKRYLQKAVEYLASAQDNIDLERARRFDLDLRVDCRRTDGGRGSVGIS